MTRLADLGETGGYRFRFPTTYADHLEAVQINTGGGIAGGDRTEFAIEAGAGTDVVFATQAAERIYRSLGPSSEISVRLSLGSSARLDWLPQETLLYSGARLHRRYEIDLTTSSRLLMVEQITYGRIASGEVMNDGALHDRWHVRRDGRMIFAEAARLDGNITELLGRPAIGGGARASAIMLYVAPDAEDRRDSVRLAMASAISNCAVSAWNGMLVARFQSEAPDKVRCDVVGIANVLSQRPLPRVWNC